MDSLYNKWIFAGSLAVVFVFTLIFSYGPGYGGGILAFLGNDPGISPKMSPSEVVTPVVTQKKVVTSRNVTNVTTVSPSMSPSPHNNDAQYYTESPVVTPTPSSVTTVSPYPSATNSVSQVNSPSPTVSPLSPSDSPAPSVTTSPVTPTPTATTDNAGSVVINEIAWMGTGGTTKLSNDEWIELYNTTNQTIDLTGWTLRSLTGSSPDPQIVLSGSIQPFGFIVLERTDNTTISDILVVQTYTGSLLDTGENLELRNSSGLLIDAIPSEGLWYGGEKDGRFSMERINPRKSGNISNNWGTNNGLTVNGLNSEGGLINGTPGMPNSIVIP